MDDLTANEISARYLEFVTEQDKIGADMDRLRNELRDPKSQRGAEMRSRYDEIGTEL